MRENPRRCSFHPARRIWRMVLARMSRWRCGCPRARVSTHWTATKVRERAPEAEGKRAVSTRISRTAEASGLAVRKIPVKPIDSIPVASALFASYVVSLNPASEVRKLALIAIPVFPLSSDSDVPKIACSRCGGNPIHLCTEKLIRKVTPVQNRQDGCLSSRFLATTFVAYAASVSTVNTRTLSF